ncbi:MAG: AAC(3) family N-acetyltransferase [Deltaproteobacteria bacterium]|nr:AAC(3) family N-acetyltransferase [Deltaproteobacteria bacterium]
MLTKQQLQSQLAKTGIRRGDHIMVYSSYKSLGGVEGGVDTVIDAFLELVGPEGNALFPTFNFRSWTENHYFDINETPSDVGAISEVARLRKEAVRTPHPIYSFAAIGKHAEEYEQCDDIEAYGENSVFSLFHKMNGLIISIGLEWNSTFSNHHYVEYRNGVHYRKVKGFSGIYVDKNNQAQIKTYTMYVRRTLKVKTYIVPAMSELYARKIIEAVDVGSTKVHFCRASTFFDHMGEIIRTHPEKLHYIEGSPSKS